MNEHTKSSSVKRFPCPNCSAEVSFNPEVAKLKCEYCGWEDKIPETNQSIEEHSYEQYLNHNNTKLARLSETTLEIDCNDCGATIEFEPPKTAGECPFCGAILVSEPKLSDPTIAPEGLIPFTIGRKEARNNIHKWIKTLWFAPNALKDLVQLEKIQGVYLPFYTYDAHTTSDYRGKRGEYYYETETHTITNEDGETETVTEEVRHTRWYNVSGRVSRFFDDVLIPATELVNQNRLNALEPWDLANSLRPYNSSYLAGFEAQRPQVSLENGFNQAKNVMASQIRCDVIHDIGGDEQQINNISTAYSAISFKNILLPVWLSTYRYHNKQFQVMINARTGEVQGDRPYSIIKIILAIITIIIIIVIIVILSSN